MLLLRALVFYVWFFGSAAVYASLIALCAPFDHRVRFAVARGWGRQMLVAGRRICGWRYLVEGEENIPGEPSVIMIKHSSVFETYAQLAIFPIHTWVLKRELMWIPIFGWGLAALKPIAINRGAGHLAVTRVIEQGKERLAQGISVVIFPEGTRMPPGQTRKYGISAATLAKEAGVPIVPVAHNAGDFWPRRGLTKKPGLIRIVIGPPMDASGRPPKETSLLVQEWIESRMREISEGYRNA
ncbi:MAG: lysophospholipid acyltransferase family protein [Woeseiaceae bacterium]